MSDSHNPYGTPSSQLELESHKIHAPFFKSWAIFFVIATTGGAAAGFVAGALLGGLMGASGASMQSIKIAAGILGFALTLPISYFTFKWSVNKYIVNNVIRVP